jgi:hypothetical protein
MQEDATTMQVGVSYSANVKGVDGYERFKLETREIQPRRRQPHPFIPRVSKVRLAELLIRETFENGFKLRRKEYRKALLSRPCIYGVFGGRFGGFHPIKEKCTGCMRCVQEYPSLCTVDRNPEFFQFPDPYWVPNDPATSTLSPVSIVSYEATTGGIPVKGMGYKGAFAGFGWDSIWTDMSEIVRPTRDGVYGREYISTLVDLGRKPRFLELSEEGLRGQASRIIETTIPVIFDNLPRSLSNCQSVTRSIALASKKIGTYFIAPPEEAKCLLPFERDQLIPLISRSSTAIDINAQVIGEAAAVELDEFDSTIVEQIRHVNPTIPIIVKLPLTRKADVRAQELAKEGIDAIHLFADYHGHGWDAESPPFVKDLIRAVHCSLVKEALRDEVTLLASGGITLAEHVPKAIMCGADLVALDTTVLIALQSKFLDECTSTENCKIKHEEFDSSWGEQRLVNLLASWHDQLIEILSAMGIRDVRRLRGDVGRAMFNEELEKEAFADIIRRT